jgi:(4S)-4-hydroxy-5-phosphonooxypentane-2,3-dione isomerase
MRPIDPLPAGAVVLFVDLTVKPEHRAEFLDAVWGDANGALDNEEGCLRFDVTVDAADPNHVLLYEVYRDAAARTIHRAAPYLKPVNEGLERWLAKPSTLIVASPLDPAER